MKPRINSELNRNKSHPSYVWNFDKSARCFIIKLPNSAKNFNWLVKEEAKR